MSVLLYQYPLNSPISHSYNNLYGTVIYKMTIESLRGNNCRLNPLYKLARFRPRGIANNTKIATNSAK